MRRRVCSFGSLKFICKINTSTRIKLIHCNFAPFQATSRSGDWQKASRARVPIQLLLKYNQSGRNCAPPPPPPPDKIRMTRHERTNEARPNFRTTSIPLGCKHIVKGIMASVATRAAK